MDSIDLTNPELVFDFTKKDLFYYQPYDIDGDGKKGEFAIAKYATCNGNWLEFVRPNLFTGKIENIAKSNQEKEHQNDNQFKFYKYISPDSLKIHAGYLTVRYYNNADFEDMKVGFYTDYYKYDRVSGKFVWQETKKSDF